MAQLGNITLTPTKVQQILEAGRKQLSPEEFEELSSLLFDLEIYGFTPWINVKLGTLMSKVQWEMELEPSPEWEEALIACDRAFLGRELKDICDEWGVSPVGHKKQLCARLYKRNVPEVVEVMEPYLTEMTPEQIKERVEQYAKVEWLPQTVKVGDPIRKFCCRICGECAPPDLLGEGKFPERIAWLRHHYKIKHPGLWGRAPRQLPQTVLWADKLRKAKDRLEDLHRKDPEEFYRRKGQIEQAIREREKGQTKTMPDFNLEELKELLKFTGRLYR